MKSLVTSLISIATVVACGGAFAQDRKQGDAPEKQSSGASGNAPPAVPADKVVVRQFTPAHVDAKELLSVSRGLFGEQIQLQSVTHEGGTSGWSSTTVPHLLLLERTILVRDLPETADRIVTTLAELDQRAGLEEKSARELADRRQREQEVERAADFASERREFRPRYVSVQSLESALKPFKRTVTFARDGGTAWTTSNLTVVKESSLVVVCETKENLDRIAQFLERVDVPAPQLNVSCLLLSSRRDSKDEEPMPKELADAVRKLVPGASFHVESVGLVNCSVRASDPVEVQVNAPSGGIEWSLRFVPQAFDADGGQLTLSDCTFSCNLAPGQQPPRTQSLKTSLTLATGEYVVLGAVGSNPVFVALRATKR